MHIYFNNILVEKKLPVFYIASREFFPGQVYFAKNNLAPRVIIHVDISVKLWAYFDVYGTTQRIRLLGKSVYKIILLFIFRKFLMISDCTTKYLIVFEFLNWREVY